MQMQKKNTFLAYILAPWQPQTDLEEYDDHSSTETQCVGN